MHDDDEPIGRVLGRRQALILLGAAGATLTVAGSAMASPTTFVADAPEVCSLDCVVKPEQMEGPYFVDERLNRSDIRTEPATGRPVPGTALTINFTIQQIRQQQCTPLPGAMVDLWQCDAFGLYSDIPSQGSSGRRFLRGYQNTDQAGAARFITILPGWYTGRTLHIHIKIRTIGTNGRPYEFTSQLYFTPEFGAAYLRTEPYLRRGPANTTNNRDSIYRNGGAQMLLRPQQAGTGYTADFAIGLDLSNIQVGRPD
ncbi:dioxygenase family protein [Crossiella cryophila]|uniref:Protocatechuate 3,4-dioxygenase beta subunit n=1 Tax=Crossiella cryophila TaxID=43355 RepID=A0A7W7CHJ8_9PSEU|nr:twin-arginine translocation pathway signal protein [Crossiella cryophila]MBB4681255.1 protocatechuate 3,4-dioxygenase beta subunit [Crossiella cryophila]